MPPRKSVKAKKQSLPLIQNLLDCSDFSSRLISNLKRLPQKQSPGSALVVPPLPSPPVSPPLLVYELPGSPAALPIVPVDAVTRKLFLDKEALALMKVS
jgi:hypothetical protein